MKDIINLAVVNFPVVWGDKEKNVQQICEYIEAAGKKGIEMIVFPETAMTGYDVESGDIQKEERMHRRLAETVPGVSSNRIAELTRKYNMYAIWGRSEERR